MRTSLTTINPERNQRRCKDVDLSDADDEGGEDVDPLMCPGPSESPRAVSSTRLPHPLLRLSHRHLPHVSPVLI
jgi:hypothetical protein